MGVFNSAGVQAVKRVHSMGQTIDTIAISGQAPQSPAGATFSGFAVTGNSGLSIANDDRVVFSAILIIGNSGESALYQQTGGGVLGYQPAVDGQSAAMRLFRVAELSTWALATPKALNNGNTFFQAAITGGGAANFAEFFGAPGNLQVLMTTGDRVDQVAMLATSPGPPRVRLSLPSISQNCAAFSANLTGGEMSLFIENFTTVTISDVIDEGGSFGGVTVVSRGSNLSGESSFTSTRAARRFFRRSWPTTTWPFWWGNPRERSRWWLKQATRPLSREIRTSLV